MLAGGRGGGGCLREAKVLKADDELRQRSRVENDEATPRAQALAAKRVKRSLGREWASLRPVRRNFRPVRRVPSGTQVK